MDYEFFEGSELNKNSEMLDDGVLLEHYVSPERDVTESTETNELFGTPNIDSAVWVKAENNCSDSLLCEQYVSELLTGSKISEQELCSIGYNNGYYHSEHGSTLNETGKYLESLDLEVTRENSLTVKDICESLENGEKVICAVSSIALFYPEICAMPGLSADCTVQVIGVDMTEPGEETVIVNNPSAEHRAVEIPLKIFMEAWQKSGCYTVMASVKRNG
ncbi:MAG: hypothetical protein IJ731_06690 [Eubacterium sp.]|nr:hypothetical protein [Eubacterium sp.]